jgi:KDO2-lipid IV(A) lauroyltransferase
MQKVVNRAPPASWIFDASPERRRDALRYWVEHPLVGLAKHIAYAALRIAPVEWGSAFGAWMGERASRRYPASDARARRLWRTLRPQEADEVSTSAAMRRLWRSVGRAICETSLLDRMWNEGRIAVEGEGHLASVRDAGRPLLVLAVHLGAWEAIPITGIKHGHMGACLGLVLENRFERRLVQALRKNYGGRMIPANAESGSAMLLELKERGPLVIFIDAFTKDRVQAPAFGRPLREDGNLAFAVRLARKTGAAIVPAYCLRQGDAPRLAVTFLPPLEPSGDRLADMARINGLFEPVVRANLDQWFYALDCDLEG